MKIGVIYMITNPIGRNYIGQSINYKSRINSYKNLRCKDQPKIYNSLIKYGFDKHIITILYEGSEDTLNNKEIEFIKIYDSLKNGMNCTEGGKVFIPTIETRLKLSEKGKLKIWDPKHIERLAIINKNNTYFKGKHHTNKALIKMRLGQIGANENKKIKVEAISKEYTIYKFNSLTEGAEFVGRTHKSVTNICAAINGKLKTAFGYKWRYSVF